MPRTGRLNMAKFFERESSHLWIRWAAYGHIVLCLLLLGPAMRIQIEEGLESFRDKSEELAKLNQEVFKTFGTEEVLLLAYAGKDLFEERSLDLQVEVLDRLEKLPLVRTVASIPQVYRDLFGAEDAEALREEMSSTPFYNGLFISKDATVAAFMLEIASASDPTQRRRLVEGTEEAAQLLKNAGFETHVVGQAALDLLLEDTTQSEMLRTFPPAFVCSVLILVLLFRSIRATCVSLLCMGMTLVLTLGLMSVTGVSLNIATSSLPILIWVLGLANLIHLTKHYQVHLTESDSVRDAITHSLNETAMPCAVSIFTTAMGFMSLIATRMVAIRQLAIWVSIGLGFSLSVGLTVGPLLLEKLRVERSKRALKASPLWTHYLSRLAFRFGPGVLVSSAALLVVTLYLTPKVRVEADDLEYFSKDSDFVQSCEFVRTRLTGIFPLDVVIDVPAGWLDPKVWPSLEALAGRIAGLEGVAKVVSPLDTLKKMNQWDHGADPSFYELPESEEAAQALVAKLDENDRRRMRSLLDKDGTKMRMTLLLSATNSVAVLRVKERVDSMLTALPTPLKGVVVGGVLLSMMDQLDLVNAQVDSFGTAVATIYLCILIGLRSWRLTLVSLFPNVMPVLCAFAIMAVCDIPLNPSTIMVASVALGISVEDVVHLLSAYKDLRKKNETATASIYHAVDRVGPAVAVTTITACIGFMALARSSFAPIRSFGILSSVAMLVALVNNLFLVPAVLTCRERWGSRLHIDRAGRSEP